jgi:hypothetical protein
MRAALTLVCLVCALAARAEGPPAGAERLRATEERIARPTNEVDGADAVDELLDGLAADLARLGNARVGPILFDRVRLSPTLNGAFGAIFEARLAAALRRAANIALLRCAECTAVRARVEESAWVVTRGVAQRADRVRLGQQYGAQTVLSAALIFEPRRQTMALDVELVRADDSSIAFAESYRLNAGNALLYRGADSAQSREQRLQQLQDRLDGRPRYGYAVDFGVMGIGGSGDMLWGGLGRVQISERFGGDGQHEAGLQLGGFMNTSELAAGMLGLTLGTRLGDASIYGPELMASVQAGMFLTGNAGNTGYAGVSLRWLAGARIALHASALYLKPFEIKGRADGLGGFCPEAGVGFTWH